MCKPAAGNVVTEDGEVSLVGCKGRESRDPENDVEDGRVATYRRGMSYISHCCVYEPTCRHCRLIQRL